MRQSVRPRQLLVSVVTAAIFALAAPAISARQSLTPPDKILHASDMKIDPAVIARRQQASLAWYMKMFVTSYEQVGQRNPKWDDAALKGLTMTARRLARDSSRPGDADDQAFYWLQRAMTLGCDDPLVEYAFAELTERDVTKLDAAHRVHAAMFRLASTKYPTYLIGWAMIESSRTLMDASRGISNAEF